MIQCDLPIYNGGDDNDVDDDDTGAAGEQQPQTVTNSSNIIPSSPPVPQEGGGQLPPVSQSVLDTRTRSGKIGNGSNGGYRRFSNSPIDKIWTKNKDYECK